MSDSDSPPRSPFAPLSLSCGESVGSSGSQNPGSQPRDHRSQVLRRSQGSPLRNGAQHTCGLLQLSLHGFGLPRTTSEVFCTSHRDGAKTIHGDQSTILPPAGYGNGKNACDGPMDAANYRRPYTARWGDSGHRRWSPTPSPPTWYSIRDPKFHDRVYAAATKGTHLTHNGVPLVPAPNTAALARRYDPPRLYIMGSSAKYS